MPTTKRKNQTDLTLRNLRSMKRKISDLQKGRETHSVRMTAIEESLMALTLTVAKLEQRVTAHLP